MTFYDIDDGRHFKNGFKDYSSENASNILSNDHEILLEFREFLIRKIKELTGILTGQLLNLSSKDISIYTGLSGIAYFYFKLSKSGIIELNDLSKESKKECENLVRRCLRHLRGRPGSMFCDDTGALAMSALSGVERQNYERVFEMFDYVMKNNEIPDEMLYGRSGYLISLLLLNKYERNVPAEMIKKIFKSIINSGLKLSKLKKERVSNFPPLYYEWHGKPYLGAAHGLSGIMFNLLQVYLNDSLIEIRSEIQSDIFDYVYPTIEFLLQLRLPSGNYPSSIGESSKRDVLVHWCHGAPGWIHMLIAAHKVFKNPNYMEKIIEIGEVIWNRGLLYKGCGICHGAAGNGYTFLAIYQYTNDPKYLYRALKFAEWCTDYTGNRTREADRPFSLFEGLAGTLHFLVDCLDPKNAKFPIYEV